MEKIGRYEIIKQIGQGGMGKVFLAFDSICQRQVALKMIREDLMDKTSFQTRFLKEVHITSHLSHPSIIPVYAIHKEKKNIFYTMPYVEGLTLQQILIDACIDQEEEKKTESIANSIPALIRLFLSLCEAIDYTHSRNVLHRDIKPENIMVGKYGELLILDWGIAEKIDEQKKPSSKLPDKVAGTISYMAPERALGKKASIKTEIYSLGIVLYRLLTLKLPFRRKDVKHYRKIMERERLLDPIEVAPYREIPKQLIAIVKKCLAKEEERYGSASDLITDIKNYIEGKPNWILTRSLDIAKKKDWLFQENVLLAKHIAITKQIDVSEWVSMMIARGMFSQNIKIEAEVKIDEKGEGIGFLLSFPRAKKRKSLEEGYHLWFGSKNAPSLELYRSNVLIAEVPDISLGNTWTKISIENVDDHLQVFIQGKPVLSYSSHLPLSGSKIGLLLKDDEFSIRNLAIYGKSHNVTVNCLAVPNAFLARKDYETALEEYRKIGKSFPGRAEGREALFRAGLTILEKAKMDSDKMLFQKALDEFEKLYNTSGAPLEYLGKSMVYEALEDFEEEAICLEFSLRKFKNHPLIHLIEEHIITRLHESSLQNREAAYRLALLSLLHLPKVLENRDTKSLLLNLKSHWKDLYFITSQEKDHNNFMALQLCFFLSRHKILIEIAKTTDCPATLDNCLFCLFEMGHIEEVKELTPKDSPLLIAIEAYDKTLDKSYTFSKEKKPSSKALLYSLCRLFLDLNKPLLVIEALEEEKQHPFYIIALMLSGKWEEVKEVFSKISKEKLLDEASFLNTLYGCFLAHSSGEKAAQKHFRSSLEMLFPPYTNLLGPYLLGQLSHEWESQAFFFEKKALNRQLALYYHCLNSLDKRDSYFKKIQDQP